MRVPASIFWDFNLPNAATWFYFSLLLAVALFFKFSRLLSMRNWDVLTVFLLVPGLLLLQEVHATMASPPDLPVASVRALAGAGQALAAPAPGMGQLGALATAASPLTIPAPRTLWFAYL